MKQKKLNYHLMPKKGWLNDPNGLVYFQGRYHIFYQADEDSIYGNVNKAWGHYSTKDFQKYIRHETAVFPDSIYDKNGAYSGSAVVKDKILYLFYTGNVKHEGNYDYILSGRDHNLMRVESKDGIHFVNKKCLLTNSDYPKDCTKHVRDPKVFEKDKAYHLVLGARLSSNQGCVLEYVSKDLETWRYVGRYIPDKNNGYMIECPDYIQTYIDNYLLCSPQGLNESMDGYRNRYESGYYKVKGNKLVDYHILDHGFDFYAPQTFYGSDRCIMIAWIGMPDNDYIDIVEDWNQALTIPRQLSFNNRIRQYPIQEILDLRFQRKVHINSFSTTKSCNIEFEVNKDFSLSLNNVKLTLYSNVLTLDVSICCCNRGERSIKDIKVNKVSIFVDESIMEIFVNNGEYTLTSRFYDEEDILRVSGIGIQKLVSYQMKGFDIQ